LTLPVLLLHLVSLGYLLLHSPKSRQTRLFSGWLGGMTLMTASQFAARLVYVPRISGYLSWWGGMVGVTLAIIALLQFAYHFPRLRYPREARIVLILSSIITGALWAWTAGEVITAWPHYVGAISSPDPDVALAPEAVWQIYDCIEAHCPIPRTISCAIVSLLRTKRAKRATKWGLVMWPIAWRCIKLPCRWRRC